MRKLFTIFLLFVTVQILPTTVQSQTTLTTGDIAFTGYSSVNTTAGVLDTFSFVLLVPVTASTVIYFTDKGYNISSASYGAPSGTDGTISWTAASAIAAGTEVRIGGGSAEIYNTSSSTFVSNGILSIIDGTMGVNALNLGTADQIIAFQGGSGSISGGGVTVLAGLHYYNCSLGTTIAGWDASGCSAFSPLGSSSMPPGLTGGTNAIWMGFGVGTGNKSGHFNCSGTPYATAAALRTALMDVANWTLVTAGAVPGGASSMCQLLSSCTAASVSSHPQSVIKCVGNSTSFNVVAAGTGLSYQWQLNSGAGFSNISASATYSGNTTASLSVSNVVAGMSGSQYRCVVSGTCGTATSNSATLTISNPTATSSSINVSCNGGSNGSIMVSPSGGISPYTYSWAPSGGSASSATGLSANTYTCTYTDALGCSNSKTVVITQPAAISSSVSQNNITCYGSSSGSASVIPSGGTAPYTYSWSPSGGIASTASGLSAGIYTCTVLDANSCNHSRTFTISQPASNTGSNSYSLPASNQTAIRNAGGYNFSGTTCELITSVTGSGASPVSGSVTNKVWVEASVPIHAGSPYVQRHYEITPANNASTATGSITLFFTQAEFDNFNAQAGSVLDLPSGPLDATGKANLRIGKYSGSSSNGTGLPATYNGATLVINPDDASIVWNAISSTWEVSFDVSGFSGFIVQTATSTLPVIWADFTGAKKGAAVQLNWSTYQETGNAGFTIQHSADGIAWNNTGYVDGAGNSTVVRQYSYLHLYPVKGMNYYRLIQYDINGKEIYSPVISQGFNTDNADIIISDLPVKNRLIKLDNHSAERAAVLYNSLGQPVKNFVLKQGIQVLDVHFCSSGMYFLRTSDHVYKIALQ